MRVLVWVLVLLLPGRVLAAPEPPPPGDFPGAQYIDRTGCVFVKDGDAWTLRLDKEGAPICGFPPSQPAEAVSAPEPPPSPEEALTAVLAEGLRAGDLATDKPRAPLAAVAPDPAQAELDATLARQVELDARIRSAMTGGAPDGLCARLGYRPSGDAAPILGGDVTGGLCPGMQADPAPAMIAAAAAAAATAPQSATPAAPKSASVAAPAPASNPRPAAARRQASEPDAAHRARPDDARPASVLARRPEPARPAAPMAEMIPAHARYVQIGAYADEANALAALRRLSGMGYRTAQRHERTGDKMAKAILAGPFADRQALVAALARLRANGYPRAVAR